MLFNIVSNTNHNNIIQKVKSNKITRNERLLESNSFSLIDNHKFNRIPNIVWNNDKTIGIYVYGYYYLKTQDWKNDWETSLLALLAEYKKMPEDIPKHFANGSYVGFILIPDENKYVIFNNHFNHLPLHYCFKNNILMVSTDFTLLSNISESKEIDYSAIGEYLKYGLIYTDRSVVKQIKTLPKACIITFKNGEISTEHYYAFPKREEEGNLNDYINRFVKLWHNIISKFDLDNDKKLSLGLTGGVDSRLILAESYKKKHIFYNTGNSFFHPDYIIASQLTKKIGVKERHEVENYVDDPSDKNTEFIKHLKTIDHPIFQASIVTQRQINWRKTRTIDIQISGNGADYIGGDHYYTRRDSVSGILGLSLGLTNVSKCKKNDILELLELVSRNQILSPPEILSPQFYSKRVSQRYFRSYINKEIKDLIGENNRTGYFLEKARLYFKFSNLLQYSMLNTRKYHESIAPYFDIELIDFASRIPLNIRINRKLMYNAIRKYYPDVSNTIIEGTFVNFQYPHWIFSMTRPIIKALNALGFRVPLMQPYLKKYNKKEDMSYRKYLRLYMMQVIKEVNSEYEFISTEFINNLEKQPYFAIWRLHNVGLSIYKVNSSQNEYAEFIEKNYSIAIEK